MSLRNRTPRFSLGSRQVGRMRGYRHHTGSDVMEASFELWDGREQRAVKLESGQTVVLRLRSDLVSGMIECEVHAPDGTLVLALGHDPVSEATLHATVAGKYRVLVTATAASGSYRLTLAPG
jgi:hypothetical protein